MNIRELAAKAPYTVTSAEQNAWALLVERMDPHLTLGRPEVVALQRAYEEIVDARRPRISEAVRRFDDNLRLYDELLRKRDPHGVDDSPITLPAARATVRHGVKRFAFGGIRGRIIDNAINAAIGLQEMERVFLRWRVEGGVLCPKDHTRLSSDGACKACESRRLKAKSTTVAGPIFWRDLRVRKRMVQRHQIVAGNEVCAVYIVDNTFAADDDYYRHSVNEEPSEWQERRHQLASDFEEGLLEPDPDILIDAFRDLEPRKLKFADCRACGKPMLVRHSTRGRPRVYHEWCKEAAMKRLQRGADLLMKPKERPVFVLPGYGDRSRKSRAYAAQEAGEKDTKDPI